MTPDAAVWKMIYLARRNPALAPEDFPQAWREHSALGRRCRNVGERVRSVAQCARVLDARLLPDAAQDYDGVNLMVLRDRASADAIWNDPETLAIMRPDEPRVFSGYVRDFTLVCREETVRDGPRADICVAGFLRCKPGLSRERLPLALADGLGRALASGPLAAAGRIVCNPVVETPPRGYEFGAVCEWWFDSLEDVERGFGPHALRSQLPAALAKVFDLEASVFMLTRVTHRRP